MIPPPPPGTPLSVRIGRIVVRLLLLGLIVWGILYAYQAYVRHQRAKEIAPVHTFAQRVLVAFQGGDYFAAQGYLDPALQHVVGIDRLASFAEEAELETMRTGRWQDWNRTQEVNATLYRLSGTLVHSDSHTQPMQWEILKAGKGMVLQDFVVGQFALRPKERTQFP